MSVGDPGDYDLASLADRAALSDLAAAYARALDARDWAAFRFVFDDQVEVDYSSLGSIHAVMAADDWTARCAVLGGFDATHHKVSSFAFDLPGGDRATVACYVDAAHFVVHEGRQLQAYVLGLYRFDCIRRATGWKIAKTTLTVTGYPVGGRAAFDEAFAVVRGK